MQCTGGLHKKIDENHASMNQKMDDLKGEMQKGWERMHARIDEALNKK